MMEPQNMKTILEEIEAIVNNSNEKSNETTTGTNVANGAAGTGNDSVTAKGNPETEVSTGGGNIGAFNGFVNEVSGGGVLGTIKDEDSNADSDFSGDDGNPN